ncbi:hypothetical protein [Achromobacter pestifer]
MRSKAIGPTFYAELVAHGGLVGNHFSWTPEGELLFFDGTPEAVRAGVEEVYADHDPTVRPPVTVFAPREFAKRFTSDELMAIRAAQFTDMEVGLVYDDFNRAEFIDLADPAVAQGISLYVAKGLLQASRKKVLLAPEVAADEDEGDPGPV